LLRATLAEQRRNLIIGTLIGLAWMAGKVAVPRLIGLGIDRGIEGADNVWIWAGLVAAAGVITGSFTAFRRFYAFREARWTET
jgi:ATP-binding cassette subfamily B protein